VASVANKMSVVIPVCFAFYFYHDSAPALKIIGLALALLAVYLTVKPANKNEIAASEKAGITKIILPLIVFVGSGVIDTLVNYAQKNYLATNSETALFVAVTFYIAGIIGVLVTVAGIISGKMKFQPKSILAGIILGIPNYFSIYFVMLAIQQGAWQSSVIYPIVNMGVVLGSTFSGVLFFREKLSKWNYAGILISVISIALIAELHKLFIGK
jgi:drug/metabolite transporter (DMT)-like permease